MVGYAQVEIGYAGAAVAGATAGLPRPPPRARWRRIVFKPSGGLRRLGGRGASTAPKRRRRPPRDIMDLRQDLDVEVAVVVGGGNFWRGRTG